MKPSRQPFVPDWRESPPREGTYRSIFKWGAPDAFKHPSDTWYEMFKQEFGLGDADFAGRLEEGDDAVELEGAPSLAQEHLAALEKKKPSEPMALHPWQQAVDIAQQALKRLP